ncbi:hypothetical protein TRFO_11045 [Tritrichomonas foetus]|uniref:Importin N-terminal domain-containing protein n=1 Tax=Tritrichomonas foetus TaxID=1144522 RepID=A0A1J4J5A1_9EUKA|nr:hypothetical protein TRFO_11045 [Tritrichomonas foetus]|eukprot:OHS94448.1 hypothetical protein TRFO_11045 [Tritrichomonas foetus]
MENVSLLLSALSNPQNENFLIANQTISQLMMTEDMNFLEAVLNLLEMNNYLSNEICFYAFSITKEYYKKSLSKDHFHDNYPHSKYPIDLIKRIQDLSFHYFSSKESVIRSEAANLFYLTFITVENMENSTAVLPNFLDLLENESTPFETVLSIMESLEIIITGLAFEDEDERKLFILILNLFYKYNDTLEYSIRFIKLMAQFNNPVFHYIQNENEIKKILEKILILYQNPNLKIDVLKLIGSPALEPEIFCMIVTQMLPLIKNDLLSLNTLTDHSIILAILNFYRNSLMEIVPNILEITMNEFLPILLQLAQSRSNDEVQQVQEWEPYTSSLIIIVMLLKSQKNLDIFRSIIPFISSGLETQNHTQAHNFGHCSASLDLLAHSFQYIPKEIIFQTFPTEHISSIINNFIISSFSCVRYSSINLLIASYQIYGFQIIQPFMNHLFQLISDCEPTAKLSISFLQRISIDPQFQQIDEFFEKVKVMIYSTTSLSIHDSIIRLLFFSMKNHHFIHPTLQFLIEFLEKYINRGQNVNRDSLNACCSIIGQLLLNCNEEILNSLWDKIFLMCGVLYQNYSLGSDLSMLTAYANYGNNNNCFVQCIPQILQMIQIGFENFDKILSFKSFISFISLIEIKFDLSPFSICLTSSLVAIFNQIQSFDVKKEILAAVVFITQQKPIIMKTHIVEYLPFLHDLSSHVNVIYSSFSSECSPFYSDACMLFALIIKIVSPDSNFNHEEIFHLVNQLISCILDFDDLTNEIIIRLIQLYSILSNTYTQMLSNLLYNQNIYRIKYMQLIEKIKFLQMQQNEEAPQ